MNSHDPTRQDYVEAGFTRYLVIMIRQRYAQLWKQHRRYTVNLAIDHSPSDLGAKQDGMDVLVVHLALEEIYDQWLTQEEKKSYKEP